VPARACCFHLLARLRAADARRSLVHSPWSVAASAARPRLLQRASPPEVVAALASRALL
jgi:hypothetical protein